MHGQLAMDLMQMPVQLFVVSIITDELPSVYGKRQEFREHRVANDKDPLMEQAEDADIRAEFGWSKIIS